MYIVYEMREERECWEKKEPYKEFLYDPFRLKTKLVIRASDPKMVHFETNDKKK
jgi:hypothetical protein